MAVNDVWQSNIWIRSGPEIACVTTHWGLTNEVEPAVNLTGAALSNAVGARYSSILELVSTASAELVCCESKRVDPTGSPLFPFFFVAETGAVAGQEGPAQAAILVSKYSGTVSASGRGRMYLPFIAEAIMSSGRLLDDVEPTITAGLDTFFSPLTDQADNEWNAVIYSKKLAAAFGLNYYVLRPVIATQRRRVDWRQTFSPDT